jgi:hypothetical protein
MSSSKAPLKKAVFTSIWCISKSNAAPSTTMHRMVVNLATGANVSLKSTPCTCENPLVTNLALRCTISPAASLLVLNTHLHLMPLRDLGGLSTSTFHWLGGSGTHLPWLPHTCSHHHTTMPHQVLWGHVQGPHWYGLNLLPLEGCGSSTTLPRASSSLWTSTLHPQFGYPQLQYL